MNFSEYRTLAQRANNNHPPVNDDFEDSQLENPSWVRKYLDLADRAIQRSKEEEEFKAAAAHHRLRDAA